MQLCLKPRGAGGIDPETFIRRGQLSIFSSDHWTVCSGCQQSQTKTREVYMEMKTVLTRPCCRLVATTLLLYSWAGDCYRAVSFCVL